MRKQRFLLCDTDEAYVQALSAFLITTMKDIQLTTFSSTRAMITDNEEYDVTLLSADFAETIKEHMDKKAVARLGNIYILCTSTQYPGEDAALSGNVQTVYKYQSMRGFVDTLCRIRNENAHVISKEVCRWTGICSPVHHELALPFALAYSMQLQSAGQDKSILFIDLEDNSIFSELCGFVPARNVTDYLYLLEDDNSDTNELLDCICTVGGVSALAPARYFQELSYIDENKWSNFCLSVSKLGYESIVVLFDTSMRGMDELCSHLDHLLVLGRDGDFFRKYDRQFQSFLNDRFEGLKTLLTRLPLSGINLADGTYQLEQLLAGNLSSYAREAVEAVSCG